MSDVKTNGVDRELIYAASEAIGFLRGIYVDLDDRRKSAALGIVNRLDEALTAQRESK